MIRSSAGSTTSEPETAPTLSPLKSTSTEETEEVPAGALFIFIGQRAKTEWLKDLIALDDEGFILTGEDVDGMKGWSVERDRLPFETSVPGVFAAGDVRGGSTKQLASAVGEGAAVAIQIRQWLDRFDAREQH